jgi:hypothetical protein
MKKCTLFCCLVSLFFLIYGCMAIEIPLKISKEFSLIHTFKLIQRDVDECVRQSSEAGKGLYKPCPDRSYGGWQKEKLSDPNDYARYLLQEYKFESDQRDFVKHCLFQKGYFKPEKPPHSY